MTSRARLRRISVVLHMVTAFIVVILAAQLWLFTVTLDAMENPVATVSTAVPALVCSALGCIAVWCLIGLFLKAEMHR